MIELQPTNAPKATRKEWLGLLVIALPCMVYSMDLTVLNLAIPELSADLHPSSEQLLWIMDIYGFLVAGFLITMGNLGDRIGRRKLLLIGAAFFGAASLLAAFANSAETLIAARAVLGIAGATIAPSTLSLISNMFQVPEERTKAIGLWALGYAAGGALGPLAGGLLLQYFWWGSVFLIAIPVMLLLLITGPILLPEFKDPQARKLDLRSAFLSLAAVLLIIFGLKEIATYGISGVAIASILAGAGIGLLFIQRQAKLADPLIDIALFRIPSFSSSLTLYGVGCFVMFGSFFYTYQYMQLVLGLTPLVAGLWALPSFAGFMLGATQGPNLLKRLSHAQLMALCLLLATIGFSIIARLDAQSSVLWTVVAMFFTSIGFAPVVTMATDLVIGSAPPERAGAASAISETSAEFGGATGMAVLGSLGTAVYRQYMFSKSFEGIPATSVQQARQTLGAAVNEANKLGADGASLLTAAQNAFINAMHVSAWVSIGILFLLIWLALRTLPGRVAQVNQTV
ncbi:MFS transporter [Flavihumibacter cheonanensis]|uniref:MFS transporter n=1 Tax=Flavihumibacter cheonanensis TaxID=1442385 RepID=UPI001EF8B73B|nr:MFS transporter [Flavihumibacter cheonanensis]MCG7752905.1 MFS transporter [Flavihumibacter cheonanensis]